ncbi:hypothetical protein, partial [Streptomyces sp. NPDC017988]
MKQPDEIFIIRTDDELSNRGVPLFARPIGVAIEWMKQNQIAGDLLDPEMQKVIMSTYHRLYPNGDFNMPGIFTGGVVIRDQIYRVNINVGFGKFRIYPLELIEISKQELEIVFRYYPEQGWRAFYGACDAWDFGYGMDDL